MKKTQAIIDAQKKANISKRPQIVFRYINNMVGPGFINSIVEFDYTFQHLWDRRRHRQPIATIVTTVKPVITGTD